MPLLLMFVAGAGVGAFAGGQADDALEGGKQGVNTLMVVGVALAAVYLMRKKK